MSLSSETLSLPRKPNQLIMVNLETESYYLNLLKIVKKTYSLFVLVTF